MGWDFDPEKRENRGQDTGPLGHTGDAYYYYYDIILIILVYYYIIARDPGPLGHTAG